MKKLFKNYKKTLNNRGFTMAEVIIAIAIIAVISACALVVIPNSTKVYDDAIARHDARILANNALSAFQYANNSADFESALNIASQGNYNLTEGGDELRYEASGYPFSYIRKDNASKTLCLLDGSDNVVAQLTYDDATNWATATDNLTRSAYKAAIDKILAAPGITRRTMSGTVSADIMGDASNVVVSLDEAVVIKNSGLGYSYDSDESIKNARLFYSQSENIFYCNSGNTWYKLTYMSAYRFLQGNYPGFVKESTKLTALPDSCKYTKGTVNAAAEKCADLLKSHINEDNGSVVTDDTRYDYPGTCLFSEFRFSTDNLTESLIDSDGNVIISKTFKDASSYGNAVLNYNRSDWIEDNQNVYKYAFKDSYQEPRQETYTDSHEETYTEDEDITYTATVSTYQQGGFIKTTYYKIVLTGSDGSSKTFDNKYKTCAAACAAMDSYLKGLDSGAIQTSGSYKYSSYTVNADNGGNTIYYTTGTIRKTTYYYNSSTKKYTTTKKTFTESARSGILFGFNENSSYTLSSATFKATVEVEKKRTVTEEKVRTVYDTVNVNLLTTAKFADKSITTIDKDTGKVYTRSGINETYTDLKSFENAQQGLISADKTFVATGDYIFSSNRIFAYINVSRSAVGGSINFYDISKKPIYIMHFATGDELDAAAAQLTGNGQYAKLYKDAGVYTFDGTDIESYKDNLADQKFTYTADASSKTIYNNTTGKYLSYTEWRTNKYITWSASPVNLDSKYSSAFDFLQEGSEKFEEYVYIGNNAGAVTVIGNKKDYSYSVRSAGSEIFGWRYSSELDFNSSKLSYGAAYISDGNGYKCEVNGYTVNISISFAEKSFSATVKDPNGNIIYALSYMKG